MNLSDNSSSTFLDFCEHLNTKNRIKQMQRKSDVVLI